MATHKLTDSSLAIVLAYAPAGLGHLRVTDALRHGLPENSNAILLPAREESIRIIHRLTSVHPALRRLMEWLQHGKPQVLITRAYRKLLLSDAKQMEQQLWEILKQRLELPTTLLIVATHFGIAHQVGAIKHRLEKRADVRVILVVQVTDDSPQSIWFVPGADLICVPSELTKETLIQYGKVNHLEEVPFAVSPYPLSPQLVASLDEKQQLHRKLQYERESAVPVNVIVPISGAGVGTSYSTVLTRELRRKSQRFHFNLVVKRNVFTEMFIDQMQRKEYVQTSSSHSDRQIIELYETAYSQAVIGFEVTKPSEQAFKAMLTAKQRGGTILLFTTPVGRQEYDNLSFLRRHTLIPTPDEQKLLSEFVNKKQPISPEEIEHQFPHVGIWRGLCIPDDPKKAAQFIWWCHQQHVFSLMHHAVACSWGDDACKHELSDKGVDQFWEQVENLL